MKLAVNYSTALHKLIETEKVKVDLLKCPEWDGLVRPALTIGQVYIHFEIALGTNKVQHLNFDLIRRMLKLTGTKFINTHLSNAAQHGSQSKRTFWQIGKPIWHSSESNCLRCPSLPKTCPGTAPFPPS